MQQKQLVTICITICILIAMVLMHLESLQPQQPKTPETANQVRFDCYKEVVNTYSYDNGPKGSLLDCNNIK